MGGAFTGAATAGANNIINAGWISKVLDKFGVLDLAKRNVAGNALEGMFTGIVAGSANGIGNQFVSHGFRDWNWKEIALSALSGIAIGSTFGAINGAITEEIFEKQMDKGSGPILNSDVAEALGERTSDVAANLEASGFNIWPFGHNYANSINLPGVICIGIKTGRCTITIDPFAPMVPKQPTYFAPKP